jgi:hypothetical protein
MPGLQVCLAEGPMKSRRRGRLLRCDNLEPGCRDVILVETEGDGVTSLSFQKRPLYRFGVDGCWMVLGT